MGKLSRQAFVTVFVFLIALLITIGYILIPEREVEKEKKPVYSYEVLIEDADLKSIYLDMVTRENSENKYVEKKLVLGQGDLLAGYEIDKNITLKKILQMKGPSDEKIRGKDATGIVYSLLVSGDIVRVTDRTTMKKTIEVRNARMTYNRIPVLEDNGTFTFMNDKKTKYKSATLDELKAAFNDTKIRKTMITW